mmetsp:Transcript_80082/g.214377  ORF Transcript_80082/g.214377 Transcript_80082/m.214377 type:complete len:187 (-) Transcript_80082:102-662(-)
MDAADLTFSVTFHDQDFDVWVKIRPHCFDFLKHVAERFEIIVFTASQKIYADKLLNLLDPDRSLIRHRVFRDSCTLVHDNYVKDLNVLGRDLSKVAILDNSPQAFGYQVSNGIPIKSWFGDTKDRCLMKLIPFIDNLSKGEDLTLLLSHISLRLSLAIYRSFNQSFHAINQSDTTFIFILCSKYSS